MWSTTFILMLRILSELKFFPSKLVRRKTLNFGKISHFIPFISTVLKLGAKKWWRPIKHTEVLLETKDKFSYCSMWFLAAWPVTVLLRRIWLIIISKSQVWRNVRSPCQVIDQLVLQKWEPPQFSMTVGTFHAHHLSFILDSAHLCSIQEYACLPVTHTIANTFPGSNL